MADWNYGIIGCGNREKNWADYFRLKRNINLVAVCDINELMLNSFEKKYNPAYAFQDLNQFLEKSDEMDFIVIATPHYLHARQTVAAANAGLHIYCEKPMATTVNECDEMIAAAKKNNIKLCIGFNRRYNQAFVVPKRLLEEKKIGDIFHANVQARWFRKVPYYLNSSPVPENEDADWEGWRGHWRTEGGSALINQTVHILDWYLAFMGSPLTSVQANAHIAMHEFVETEDNVAATVTFANGALGLIQAGTSYKYDSDKLEFYGNKGTLIQTRTRTKIKGQPFSWFDKLKYSKGVKLNNKHIMMDFLTAIEEDSEVPVSGEEGRKTIELIRAIYHSVMQKKRIEIPFEDNTDYPELERLDLEISD